MDCITGHRRGIFDGAQRRERGVVAISIALLSVVVAGGAMVSFALVRAKQKQAHVLEQAQFVAWADKAVQEFAVVHGRLPCPASMRDGPEDCTGSGDKRWSKGWLPTESLVKTKSLSGAVGLGVRYLVFHGEKTAPFLPSLESGEPPSGYGGMRPPTSNPAIFGTMELCAKLFRAQEGQITALTEMVVGTPVERLVGQRWRIAADAISSDLLATVSANEMAYGVAVAARGAPAIASGVNANFEVGRMESPLRAKDMEYADVVKITGRAELYDALGCAGASAALDTMAVAHQASELNESNRKGVVEFADQVVSIAKLSLAADSVGLAIQGADMANGAWNLVVNQYGLLTSILAFDFWGVANHTAGTTQAIAGMALTAVDMALSAGAIGVDVYYIEGYEKARDQEEVFKVWTGGESMLEQAHKLGISPTYPPEVKEGTTSTRSVQ